MDDSSYMALAVELAERGYRMAEKRHRWKNRAGLLMQALRDIDK